MTTITKIFSDRDIAEMDDMADIAKRNAGNGRRWLAVRVLADGRQEVSPAREETFAAAARRAAAAVRDGEAVAASVVYARPLCGRTVVATIA
jgi:hypothetical protein